MPQARKNRILLLVCSGAALLTMLLFALFNWDIIIHLFSEMLHGVAIAKEYILETGAVGVLAMSLLIIVFFFFPVISSVPIQVTSVISYGLPLAMLHVSLSIFAASQLAFLFTRCIGALQSPKKQAEQRAMEEKIRNSKRSIYYFLFIAYLAPFVPFMLIHTVAASSGMKWWKYALVTLFGPLPDIFITLWLGKQVTSTSPIASFIILMVIIVCVVLSLAYKEKIVDLVFSPKKKDAPPEKQSDSQE